jgi:hypothetical protein
MHLMVSLSAMLNPSISDISVSDHSVDNRDGETDWDTEVSTMRHTIPFTQKYRDLFIGVLALLAALALFELILAAPLI